jgi:hypothetical protein
MFSKVRTQIKLKEFKLKPADESAGAEEMSTEDLPKIVGSMDEYSKLLGQQSQKGSARADESDDEDGDDGDDLWGAIMGGKDEDDNEDD